MLFPKQTIEHDTQHDSCSGNADPAKSHGIQRKLPEQFTDHAERNLRYIQCIYHADTSGRTDGYRIYIAVLFPHFMAKTEQYQHNGYRANRIQYRDRDVEDRIEAQVADQEREYHDDVHPLVVADLGEKGGEKLGNGIDQTNASGQAGQCKNSCQ